jgi:uncharacterized membrane-anchored protein YhcB (DUF1043 family)
MPYCDLPFLCNLAILNMSAVLLIFALAFLALIVLGVLYSLIDKISIPGGILIFVLILWLIIRKAVYISIFPGCSYFWRRNIEANYLKEISLQVSEKLKSLKDYLENLKSGDFQLQEFHIHNSKVLLNTLIDNYESLPKKMSRNQGKFYALLIELKKTLESIEVLVNNTETYSVFDWLDLRFESQHVETVVLSNDNSWGNFDMAI